MRGASHFLCDPSQIVALERVFSAALVRRQLRELNSSDFANEIAGDVSRRLLKTTDIVDRRSACFASFHFRGIA